MFFDYRDNVRSNSNTGSIVSCPAVKSGVGKCLSPVSWEVIEQHGAANVHSVRSLTHYDAVFRQELRNLVERYVVVHGQSGLESKTLWETIIMVHLLPQTNTQFTG